MNGLDTYWKFFTLSFVYFFRFKYWKSSMHGLQYQFEAHSIWLYDIHQGI